MDEALENAKEDQYRLFEDQASAINLEMYAVLQQFQDSGNDDEGFVHPVFPSKSLEYDFEQSVHRTGHDALHSSNENNDSDDEQTPAELLDCLTHETDMFSVDYYDDACTVLLAQPEFIVLRQTAWTSLVLFPDGTHAIFTTSDVETAQQTRLVPSVSSSDLRALAISYCAAALNRPLTVEETAPESSSHADPTLQSRNDAVAPLAPKSWEHEEKSFVIWFDYKEEKYPNVVWAEMPVALLVEAAFKLLERRGMRIQLAHIVLMHENRFMDATFERLSDHNVEPDDQVDILVVPQRLLSKAVSPKAVYPEPKPDGRRDILVGHQRSITKVASSEPLYYAVRRGHTPGLYRSWDECERQVSGFSSSEFKSFPTEKEAQNYLSAFLQPYRQLRDPISVGKPARGSQVVRGSLSASPKTGIDSQQLPLEASSHEPTKYYAVRKGRLPGIYRSWDECERQVSGFPHCEFKSFRTEGEARNYFSLVSQTPFKAASLEPHKYYAVRKGRRPGIYRFWEECEIQVSGYPLCEFKSFRTEGEAQNYLASVSQPNRQLLRESPTSMDNCGKISQPDHRVGPIPSQDKIKQAFKCPRFSGNAKDWKIWNKGFQRYLSIWDLDHVLHPDFFDNLPLSFDQVRDNKLVYYLLEDATQGSPLASSYLRQAAEKNGFEAYYTLHDGFVFAAATTSTLLLNELSNFRFKQDETPTELIMRLDELIQDLELLPEGVAMKFNDTQCIGYLLGALRHEPLWATVASAITSSQLKGEITFRQACNELRLRCETDRAYDIMDKEVKAKRKVHGLITQTEPLLEDAVVEKVTTALISSVTKRLNKEVGKEQKRKGDKKKFTCLAKGCTEKSAFPLCGLHYHSVVSGKIAELELVNEYGNAVFNVTTKFIEYPPKVPKDRLPSSAPSKQ
jgi:viroplasmin and RNaseH domain-containing protein